MKVRILELSALGLVLGAAGALVWAGCKSNDQPAPIVLGDGDEGDDEDGQDGIDEPGSMPPAPGEEKTPIPTKIRYVMVLVKENHTFDNYFTGFPGAESAKTAKLSNGKTLTRKRRRRS